MKTLLVAVLAAGLLACCHAGGGTDLWGVDTLTNYPSGQSRKTIPAQAGDAGVQTPIDLPCQCSDADPRDAVSQVVTYDCFFQRVYQKCSDPNMFDANAELAPEGFCQMSCSRCNCCQSAWDVIAAQGATRFLQAVEAAQPSLKDLLQHPGFTGTVLVPSDAAFDAALARYQGLLQNPTALQEVLKFHILPVEPVRRGLWTSPFMSLGPKLYTFYDGPQALQSARFPLPAGTTWQGGLTGFQISGPFNPATVTKSDIPACKAVVTLIDSVLLPFDPAGPVPADAASLLGVPGFVIAPNAFIAGPELRAGDSSRFGTIAGCAQSCQSTPGCTAFNYCALKGGCRQPGAGGIVTLKYGYCQLLSGTANPPAFQDSNPVTVQTAAGYVGAPAPVAAPATVAVPATVAAAAGPIGRRLFRA